MSFKRFNVIEAVEFTNIGNDVAWLKRLVVGRFRDYCGNGLIIMTFHLKDNLMEELGKCESIEMLDASQFK